MLCRSQKRALSPRLPVNGLCQSKCAGQLDRSARFLHVARRARLSKIYMPLGAVTDKDASKDEESHEKLVRAGFLRKAHSGIYHIMPFGLRVQEKLAGLIDQHMEEIGASRLSLSSISSESMWKKSGRFKNAGPELFRFSDRKKARFLLSPTHEEEITDLVNASVVSHNNLPLRVYQITRKYRDELRPRKGLLRAREFIMKDLYTFDVSVNSALSTYNQVRSAYDKLFAALRLPVRVAEASSGDIGGDLSHEYHLPDPQGEDDLISCDSCDLIANSEVAEARQLPVEESGKPAVWRGISKDRLTLINVWYPESVKRGPSSDPVAYTDEDLNMHAVKRLIPDVDGSVEVARLAWWEAMKGWKPPSAKITAEEKAKLPKPPRLVNIIDYRLSESAVEDLMGGNVDLPYFPFPDESMSKLSIPPPDIITHSEDGKRLDLLTIRDRDACPRCESGSLSVQKAIELGHTFHLGTRYSEPMKAYVPIPKPLLEEGAVNGEVFSIPPKSTNKVIMQMGCHGIGVSRIIGAIAEHLVDEKGLNWPRAIAPYEVVIVVDHRSPDDGSAERIYDLLAGSPSPGGASPSSPSSPGVVDVLIDDRAKTIPWKLKDADLVGYPVIVTLGKQWIESQSLVEVQCRRLGVKSAVSLEELPSFVNNLLEQL